MEKNQITYLSDQTKLQFGHDTVMPITQLCETPLTSNCRPKAPSCYCTFPFSLSANDAATAKKHRRKSSRMSGHGDLMAGISENDMDMDDGASEGNSSKMTEPREQRDQLINPYWLEEKPTFSRGEVDYLSGPEIQFWKDMIDKYLYPLDADKAKQAAIAHGLKELRDKSVFFFCVFNALFVLIVFMLTLHKDTLHIDWPFGVKENITITEDERVRGIRGQLQWGFYV
jgi:hypothetical protein